VIEHGIFLYRNFFVSSRPNGHPAALPSTYAPTPKVLRRATFHTPFGFNSKTEQIEGIAYVSTKRFAYP
jgi:hypothetical protein